MIIMLKLLLLYSKWEEPWRTLAIMYKLCDSQFMQFVQKTCDYGHACSEYSIVEE